MLTGSAVGSTHPGASPSRGGYRVRQPLRGQDERQAFEARFKHANSRRLRANATDAEARLWYHLWRIPIEGTHFRRQVAIGPYFADFACHQIGLIIELDGSQHATDVGLAHDAVRTAFLEAQGYQVLRFWNADVFDDIDGVLDTIFAIVQQRQILLAGSGNGNLPPPPCGGRSPRKRRVG